MSDAETQLAHARILVTETLAEWPPPPSNAPVRG